MSTSKNDLQTFLARNRLPVATYNSKIVGGSHHEPKWRSTVSLHDGTSFEGDILSSKTKAETSAAALAYQYLSGGPSSSSEPPKHALKTYVRTALLVDVENMPKLVEEAVAVTEGLDIYAFVGAHHCLATKNFDPKVIKIVSPSTRSDGTDTCIQVYVGYLLSTNAYDHYLIGTRDRFGSALVDIITNPCLWRPVGARLITDVTHL